MTAASFDMSGSCSVNADMFNQDSNTSNLNRSDCDSTDNEAKKEEKISLDSESKSQKNLKQEEVKIPTH